MMITQLFLGQRRLPVKAVMVIWADENLEDWPTLIVHSDNSDQAKIILKIF